MRAISAAAFLTLGAASLAAAQSTTTTVVPTSSTSIGTSTSTTTSTSTSIGCTDPTLTFENFDPRECSRTETAKEECRESCCTDDFECLADSCNADGACDDAAWEDFREQWVKAGDFYKFCQNPEDDSVDGFDIGAKFSEFNVSDSCRQYSFGCKRAARKHVRQCADDDRCIACCSTVLKRWRVKEVRKVKAQGGGACTGAIKCLRRATRKGEACRNACRRKPTCGEAALRGCLERSPGGRQVLECYGKCTDKCSNRDSYRWCLQACQGLDDCGPFDECSDSLGGGNEQGCLTKESSECVPVTTTTTSTSSSTSSTSQSTTSTSSSTSTSSPLLRG